ncbi:MAG: hypothetical protein DRP08_07530, partial [Candidatus Aenigmatarchaeota archaeon]
GIHIRDVFPWETLEYSDNATPYEPDTSEDYLIWKIVDELEAGDVFTIEYDATAVETGIVDNIADATYKEDTSVTDEDSVTVKIITGGGGNTPPVANDDSVTVHQDSTNNIIHVLENDYDPDGDQISIYSITNPPSYGIAKVSDDVILYTPNPGYNGTDSFTYKITDEQGDFDTAFVLIQVTHDHNGVSILLSRPKEGYLYILDVELLNISGFLKYFDGSALVIGPITFEINNETDFYNDIEHVEYYIDNELVNTTSQEPFNYTLNRRCIGIRTIKIVAHTSSNMITEEKNILIINFGLTIDNNNGNSLLRLRKR